MDQMWGRKGWPLGFPSVLGEGHSGALYSGGKAWGRNRSVCGVIKGPVRDNVILGLTLDKDNPRELLRKQLSNLGRRILLRHLEVISVQVALKGTDWVILFKGQQGEKGQFLCDKQQIIKWFPKGVLQTSGCLGIACDLIICNLFPKAGSWEPAFRDSGPQGEA